MEYGRALEQIEARKGKKTILATLRVAEKRFDAAAEDETEALTALGFEEE